MLLDPPVLLPAPGRAARGAARGNASRAPARPAARSIARPHHRPPRRRRPRRRRRRSRPFESLRPTFEHDAVRAALARLRRRRRLRSRAASRDVVGDRRAVAPRRRLDQSNDDRDLPAESRGVRRQHQCVARRRDVAPARVGRFRHVGDDRRQRRSAAADGRVAEPRDVRAGSCGSCRRPTAASARPPRRRP